MTGIPPDSFCRLNPEVCDPVSAGLVNEQEVLQYFKLYFKIRHPSVGILDPDLHTAEYVHGCSFTLFSVICALGCELSISHRDILLAPLLYNMAERNIKWSILNSVKTVEIIQAIIMFTFWSHAAQNYADDPSWLRFGHVSPPDKLLNVFRVSNSRTKCSLLHLGLVDCSRTENQ
jgi:hypothetical protein